MNEQQKPGSVKVWAPLAFSIVLIAGMVLGFNLRDSLRKKRDIQAVIERNDRLEQVIDLINEKYVDTVNINALYKDAMTGILSHLDPHTVYIPADELDAINEDLEGSFFGIGVEFSIIRDTIQVTSVIEDGPASRSGVETGDQLIKVGDSVVAGTGITSERIIKMLKGKQYSRVLVTLKQHGGQQKVVTIKRDVIPLYSVEASIMLDSITGYIKINRFSATTYDEFVKALTSLQKQGMQQLVLDLRQNPGGYLNAATSIADEFLGGNKLIVYTKGKHSLRTEYRTGSENKFENGRLAVLVDENAASASEILAGAIQDWDRGIIIGRRTFGKGLVQEQYDMDDGSALRLTIAKYYTPSGRCIQRSFAKGKEAYSEDFVHRFETGELTGFDTTALADTTKYYTSQKRVVYGGGGIKPDVYVPYDTGKLSNGLLNLLYSDDVKNVVWDYFLRNKAVLDKYASVKVFDHYFDGGQLVKSYLNVLQPHVRIAAGKILKVPYNDSFFRLQMKAQLARILYRNNGYYTVSLKDDNVARKALQILHSKNYSSIISR